MGDGYKSPTTKGTKVCAHAWELPLFVLNLGCRVIMNRSIINDRSIVSDWPWYGLKGPNAIQPRLKSLFLSLAGPAAILGTSAVDAR